MRLPVPPLSLAAGLCLAWLSALPSALAAEPLQAGELRVHDRVAFVFRAPDGARSPAQRAAEASRNFEAVVDEGIPGALSVDSAGDRATVRVGTRQLFTLVQADAAAFGARDLAELAPRIQGDLDSFLTQERRRSRLQRSVLGTSLVVFFAVLAFLALRALHRRFRSLEERIGAGETVAPAWLSKLGLSPSGRSAGALLLGAITARLLAQAVAIYLFLLGALSVFDGTQGLREVLNATAAAPFIGLAHRLFLAAPEALLILVLYAVIRSGFRVTALRMGWFATGSVEGTAAGPSRIVPHRLLARVALVLLALLLVPVLLSGDENGLFPRLGLLSVLLLGLCLVPLGASVMVGLGTLLGDGYRPGDWLRVTLSSGRELVGEVTSVDFFHLRLVPNEGGEIRLPHLATLWHPVTRLRAEPDLMVELRVTSEGEPLAPLVDRLLVAAKAALLAHGIAASPEVELVRVGPCDALVRVTAPKAPARLRTALFLALAEAAARQGEAPPGDAAAVSRRPEGAA